MKNLIICKTKVSPEQLLGVQTPAPTDSHIPVPHSLLVSLMREAVERAGMAISHEEHGLARDGMNYFGGFALSSPLITAQDRKLVLGLRNSHLKQFAASICLGNSMLVCENLHFSSDTKLGRRHTTNILADLPRVLADAIGRCLSQFQTIGDRFEAYKVTDISKQRASDLLIDLVDAKALPARDIYNVMQEFRNPRHDEFKGQTLFSLFQGFTETMKGSDLSKLPFRSMVTESIFDRVADFSPRDKVKMPAFEEEGSEETPLVVIG
jgi:hypothetical protein